MTRLLSLLASAFTGLAAACVDIRSRLGGDPEDNPVQRWFDGEPMHALPHGTRARVLVTARRHAYIVKGAVEGLEGIHIQAVDRYSDHMDELHSDERMQYLALGVAYGGTHVGEAVIALRDWVVGRLGT